MVTEKASRLNKTQLISIVTVVIVDIVLAVVLVEGYNVVLAPVWGGQKQIEQYFALIFGVALLLAPTILILKRGWKDRITSEAYRLPLRFGFAAFFLKVGFDKVLNPGFFVSPGTLSYALAGNPNPFIKGFLTMLSSNEVTFLYFAAIGEVVIGVSMLLGVFTRLGGLGSTVMLVTYLLSFGYASSAVYGINLWGALAGFDLAMNRSGRYFGLDQFLGSRLDKSKNVLLRVLGSILT